MQRLVLPMLLTMVLLGVTGQVASLGATDDEKLLGTFKQSDLLLVGTIAEVKEVATSNSVPPVYLMNVTFKEVKMLRGNEPANLAISYQTPDPKEPILAVGKKVVAASWMFQVPGGGAIRRSMLVEATDANLKLAAQAAATQPATAPQSQPATASQPTGGSVSGKVVREGSGTAVANAKVEIRDAQKRTVVAGQTDAQGVFLLENVPVGEGYTLRAFDPSARAGAEGWKKGVSVQASKATEVGAVTVYALPG
jgi:hypothetical protein